MARIILRYKLVKSEEPELLSKKIDKLIGEEWELYGNPVVAKGGNYGSEIFCQAMVRTAFVRKGKQS